MAQLSIIELNYDILRHICVLSSCSSKESLKNISRASKHLRDVAIPFVFEAVTIRGDWDAVLHRLEEMENSAGLLSHVKCCKFSPQIKDPQISQPAALPLKLARAIGRMIRLEKLGLFIPEYHTFPFEAAFRQENVLLTRVDFLAVGPYSEFVVPLCPNVTTIATSSHQWLFCKRSNEGEVPREHSLRLIKAAGGASKLTHLAMFEWWSSRQLETILVAVPNLSSLSMECSSYSERLTKLVTILSRFNNLQYLSLASAFDLKVTDFQPPWCGNAYDGPGGDQLLQRVEEEQEKATKMVVQMVFPVCRQLKVLWIGDRQRAEVRRTEEGDVADITWIAGIRQNLCE